MLLSTKKSTSTYLLVIRILAKVYWRLNKALYGLKQSGRQWNILFTDFLKNNNFIQIISEPCIFKKMEGGIMVCLISIYVDDLLIAGINNHIHDIIKKIKKSFKISKCNPAGYILGINIERNNFQYSINQIQFIKNILEKFKITNIRKSKTPCTNNYTITNNNDQEFDKTTYKSANRLINLFSKMYKAWHFFCR